MTLTDLTTIEHLERCLDGSETCTYELPGTTDERSSWIQTTLVQFRYTSLGTRDRGVVIRSLLKVSGSSRHQLTRLIRQSVTTGRCTCRQRTTRGFSRRSTQADVLLLAELDRLHDTPCGAVIKKECERALAQGDDRCERLAAISVSHIDTLRTSTTDQRQRRQFTTPHSKPAPIGERRRASRGSLRVDRVHQGDQDTRTGVSHITLVDEVTQFEICVSVERISEASVTPALELAMARLPFRIRGFHSDTGSECINKTVAKLLDTLLVEFTKSRTRHSHDNALVESTHGSVVRTLCGSQHIPQHWASQINDALLEPMYRSVNVHRPCLFPLTITDAQGKQIKRDPSERLMTPFEQLCAIEEIDTHLTDGQSLEALHEYAQAVTDTQAAEALQTARHTLFTAIFKQA